MAIQNFDCACTTKMLTLNWGFDRKIQIFKGSEKFQRISSEYIAEKKNWEEHDANLFI